MTENLLQVWSNNFSGYIIHSNILWPLYVICYRYDEYTVVSDAKYCVKGKKRIFDCALASAFFQKRTWTRKFGKIFSFQIWRKSVNMWWERIFAKTGSQSSRQRSAWLQQFFWESTVCRDENISIGEVGDSVIVLLRVQVSAYQQET